MMRIRTSGTAFERGLAQGQAARELASRWIQANLAEMRSALDVAGLGEAAHALEHDVGTVRRSIERALPAVHEECRGIARGLDLGELDYFTVLLWPYLSARWADGRPEGGASRSCTSVGVRGTRGEPLLGKTDDLPPGLIGLNVLELCAPAGGYRHAHLHLAASPWTVAGMNERGLAIAMTGLPGPYRPEAGVPSLFALRPLLERCSTARECERLVREIPLGALGFSLAVADVDEMLLLERTGADTAIVSPREGVLIHTNTILDPELERRSPPQREPLRTNAVGRYEAASELAAAMERSGAGMAALLSSRPAQGPIFQLGEGGLHTDFAVVLEPRELRMSVWASRGGEPEHLVRMEEL